MPDANEFVALLKKAAVDAVDAQKPTTVCFGVVSGTSPLQINVEQKMTLGTLQLILTERVTENGLEEGDQVILIRMQGGQKYIVLDRIGVMA